MTWEGKTWTSHQIVQDLKMDMMAIDLGIDIHDCEDILRFAKKESSGFKLHPSFAGGRFQTKHPWIFLHIGADCKLKKVEVCKPGGTLFYLRG